MPAETTTPLPFTASDWFGGSIIDLAIVVAAAAISVAILLALRAALKRWLGAPVEGAIQPHRIVARLTAHTYTLFLVAAGLYAVLPFVQEPRAIEQLVKLTFTVFAVIQGAIWFREISIALIERQAALRQADESAFASAVSVLSWLVNLVVWSIAILLILDNLGVNVTALVAGLGVGGIAVGLAAQGIVSDLFSAISILMDRPFVRGDFIAFGDAMGEVENIGLKTTRIRALSGEQIVVSNAKLLSQEIHNHRRMANRRVMFTIDAALTTPSEKAAEIPTMLREAVTAAQRVRFDRAHLIGFSEGVFKFEIVYFVLSREYNTYADVHQSILLAILRRFEAEEISFGSPARSVRLVDAPAKQEEPATTSVN